MAHRRGKRWVASGYDKAVKAKRSLGTYDIRKAVQAALRPMTSSPRLIAERPGLDFYELRHAAATMLLERGMTPWDVAVQLGHTDGGQLVMSLYGHPEEAGSLARILGTWDQAPGPQPIRSGVVREQAPQKAA